MSLSNLLLFNSAVGLVDVYTHEFCHSLLHSVPNANAGHDVPFFALNYLLRSRVDASQIDGLHASLTDLVSLYDLEDRLSQLSDDLDQGLGRCITWSIQLANELADADLSAEAAAREIVKRCRAVLIELSDRTRRAQVQSEQAERQAHRQAASVERLKDMLFVSNLVACASSVLLVLIAVMLWHR